MPTVMPDCVALKAKTTTDWMQKSDVIDGFKPRNAAVAAMGYQKPGPCAANPLWPKWVPVNLVPDGIVTKPCQ